MKIRMFTPVWGETHIERFRQFCLRSLLWPKNRHAIANGVVGWDVYTRPQDFKAISELCYRFYPPTMFRIGEGDNSQILMSAVRRTLEQCLLENSHLMTVMPDVIYGEGTFEMLFQLAERPNICLLVPHMRALPSIAKELGTPLSNTRLFGAALNHAHQTWRDANIALPENNVTMGGVLWQQIAPNIYAVQHRLANPWVSFVTPSDIDWWKNQIGFGTFDHNWPGKMVAEGRARWIGSNEAAFMVEVTGESEGLAPMGKRIDAAPDTFYRPGPHHDTSRFFVNIWKAE